MLGVKPHGNEENSESEARGSRSEVQLFLTKSGPAALTTPGSPLDMQNLESQPYLLNQTLQFNKVIRVHNEL